MARNKVKVNIASKSYTIIGEDSTEHMIMVGQLVDASVREISANYPALSISDRAVLAAINVADEYIKTREKLMRMVEELTESEQSLIIQLGDMTSRAEGMKIDLVNAQKRAMQAENALAEIELIKEQVKVEEPAVSEASEAWQQTPMAEPEVLAEPEAEPEEAEEPEDEIYDEPNLDAEPDEEPEPEPDAELAEVEVNLDEMGWSGFEVRTTPSETADEETDELAEQESDEEATPDDDEKELEALEESQNAEEPGPSIKTPEMDAWGESEVNESWGFYASKADTAEEETEDEADDVPFYVEEEAEVTQEPDPAESDSPDAPIAEEPEAEKAEESEPEESQSSTEIQATGTSDFYDDESFMNMAPKLDDWATPSQTVMTIDKSIWDTTGMEPSSFEQEDVKVDDFETEADEDDTEEVVLSGQTRFDFEDESDDEDDDEEYPDTSMLDRPGFDYNEDED